MAPPRPLSTAALALFLLLTAPGCPTEPVASPPVTATAPLAPPLETEAQRCARIKATHVNTPPQKLEGGPAVLTPEGSAAGIQGSVSASCFITPRGEIATCRLLADGIPESLQGSVLSTLKTWRFRPGTHDGAPIPDALTVDVPLVSPPPGWTNPQQKSPAVALPAAPPSDLPPVTLPFAQGMVPPRLLSGTQAPDYPKKARDACAEGKVVARCTVTLEGQLVDCEILKSVPELDAPVLANLAQRRYTPVLFHDKPVKVYYTFPFTFRMP